MEKSAARAMVKNALENPFDKGRFGELARNILYDFDDSDSVRFINTGRYIRHAFAGTISALERLGTYTDADGKRIDILRILLKKDTSLERARTAQRNFVAHYLTHNRDNELRDAALVAFVAPGEDDWRFSFVKMEYRIDENGKVKEDFTPARRYSFLVGEHENSHTAQSRLMSLLTCNHKPTLTELEEAFSVEPVTKEFFTQYRDLFLRLKDALDEIVKAGGNVAHNFKEKKIDTGDFAKKTLGQIVFLYFLQKKGWFGVKSDKQWGEGSKQFLRELFERKHGGYKNFFNGILEPLFYEALRYDRGPDDDHFSKFDCKIPFLNGGLFDPMNDYDWIKADILLGDDLFSNDARTKAGDVGTGILDVFDRYNFTVAEDEPLEKEVAVDPEMLGKVFENLLEIKDRKSKGTYYTPREIVHYMCRESLINYLVIELGGAVDEADIETLIQYGGNVAEHDSHVTHKGVESDRYSFKLPEAVRENAKTIDAKLASIRVCDPAVGSGAFPVGMMSEIVRVRKALTSYIGEKRERTAYHFKRHAIEKSLYGVDSDAGAVEIAKLRLWLSLVVDEGDRKAIQPLPNLDYKIMQGNSLLGARQDVFSASILRKIEKIKSQHVNETRIDQKQKNKKKIDDIVNKKDFNFHLYFSEVFGGKGGFDVVIANPPYVSAVVAAKTIDKSERQAYKSIFASASRAYDLYVLFFEVGILNLKENGVLTLISPSKYLSAYYAMSLRKLLLDYAMLILTDLSHIRAFKSAAVSTLVTIIKKGSVSAPVRTVKVRSISDLARKKVRQNDRKYLSLFPENMWGVLLSDHVDLTKKIWEQSIPMSSVAEVVSSSTAAEADEYVGYISETHSQTHHKIINTGTIDHIHNLWGKYRYKNKKESMLMPYIDLSKVNARRREMYKQEKLIFSKVAPAIRASYDKNGEFASTNTNLVYGSKTLSLSFLAAYVNSSLSDFVYKQIFGGLNMFSGYQFQAPQLRILPVPKFVKDETLISNCANAIWKIGAADDYMQNAAKKSKVRAYEKQIDELVYKLYNLTPAEIAIIENHQNK